MGYTGSRALESQGSTFTWDSKPVGEGVTFTGPGGKGATYQVTNLQSSRVEKRPNLPDEGDFTFACNLIPDDEGQEQLRDDRATRTLRTAVLTLSDGTVLTFSAYCTGFEVSGKVDNKIDANITLAITGEVVWSVAESS